MALPDFQSCMPSPRIHEGWGRPHALEACEVLAHFRLTAEECTEFLPSGRQRRLENQVWWAKSYLDHAGLLRSPRRGRFHITDRGRAVLQEAPSHLDITFLERFEEFREFRRASNQAEPVSGQVTPERSSKAVRPQKKRLSVPTRPFGPNWRRSCWHGSRRAPRAFRAARRRAVAQDGVWAEPCRGWPSDWWHRRRGARWRD